MILDWLYIFPVTDNRPSLSDIVCIERWASQGATNG
jgi:hypothetical protein